LFNYYVLDAYGNLIDDSEWRQDEPDSDASEEEARKDDGVKIEKFRDLIRSLQDDKPGRQDDAEFEMEVTWEPGTKCVLLAVVWILSWVLYAEIMYFPNNKMSQTINWTYFFGPNFWKMSNK